MRSTDFQERRSRTIRKREYESCWTDKHTTDLCHLSISNSSNQIVHVLTMTAHAIDPRIIAMRWFLQVFIPRLVTREPLSNTSVIFQTSRRLAMSIFSQPLQMFDCVRRALARFRKAPCMYLNKCHTVYNI